MPDVKDRPNEVLKFMFWITLEVLLVFAFAIVNFVFLFTRSFIKEQFVLTTFEFKEFEY